MKRIGALSCCMMLLVLMSGCATGRLGNGAKTTTILTSKAQASKAYAAGHRVRALKAYERYVALNPRDADAWTRLGNLHLMGNEVDRAVDAYRKALRIDRTDVEAWHNLALIRMRQAHAAMIAEGAQLDQSSKRREKLVCKMAWLTFLEGDSNKPAPSCTP